MCFVASSAIVSNAAQPGVQGAGQNISVAPGTSAPKILMQPLTVNMSGSNFLCNDLLQRIESIKQLKADLHNIGVKEDEKLNFPGTWELFYSGYAGAKGPYKDCINGCCSPSKSFSVQDQQEAGCVNSETLQQCLDKLVKRCISAYATKNQHKLDLQASQEKSNNISIKTKQLSEQIKYLLSIMP
jgi:hypothetical protein